MKQCLCQQTIKALLSNGFKTTFYFLFWTFRPRFPCERFQYLPQDRICSTITDHDPNLGPIVSILAAHPRHGANIHVFRGAITAFCLMFPSPIRRAMAQWFQSDQVKMVMFSTEHNNPLRLGPPCRAEPGRAPLTNCFLLSYVGKITLKKYIDTFMI